jgi:transmembrane sensor
MHAPAEDNPLHQAARWYVQLGAEDRTEQDHADWQVWRDSDPRHAEAWQQVEKLQTRLRPLPRNIGHVLMQQPRSSRRSALNGLALVCLGLCAWTLVSTQTDWLSASQTFATLPGERQQVTLEDGSRLLLNTDSQVEVRYGPKQRTVRLLHGELQIQTAHDNQPRARAFVVDTLHGHILALGTRFTVRLETAFTHVAVQEHAVLIQPESGSPALQLGANQAASFSANDAGQVHMNEFADQAWVDGRLIVLAQPLAQFALELSRYRRVPLEVDPRIAQLKVSGTFLLDEPERSLRAAVAQLPVRLVMRDQQVVQIVPR